jgi:DNA (cytosine-5)-methyltransferase 1
MKLYQEILFLRHYYDGQWIIENVDPFYDPLISADCKMGRHLFWSNFKIRPTVFEDADINRGNLKEWQSLHGFSLEGRKINHRKDQILRNCVNPELGLYILEQARGIVRQDKTTQTTLFTP